VALCLALGCALGTQGSDAWVSALSRPLPRAPERNWPLPPADAEALMTSADGTVRERERTDDGVTGAQRFTVHFPAARREIDLKWKAAPPGEVDGWNNSPRKELAAYIIQKWFLAPEAYVVPTAIGRCVRLDAYRELDPDAKPTLPGTACVFGVLSLWLENVEVPEELFDASRFRREPAYARHLANFNLLAYVIDDRDTRPSNVLTSKDASNRRVFSVDNGISFGPDFYNFLVNHWSEIRVPALPRDSIERLRQVTAERARALTVVAQFQLDAQGMLRPVRAGAPIAPDRGVAFEAGTLQLGLTQQEIGHVLERVRSLLREVDERRIPLF
jgi:hypothetical protein